MEIGNNEIINNPTNGHLSKKNWKQIILMAMKQLLTSGNDQLQIHIVFMAARCGPLDIG